VTAPAPAQVRCRIDPRGVPAAKAARRLGLTPAAFEAARGELERRDFPGPDPTTGNYDLAAIDAWMDRQHPVLLGRTIHQLDAPPPARNAQEVFRDRARRLRMDGAG
jgi:hypothetical protein